LTNFSYSEDSNVTAFDSGGGGGGGGLVKSIPLTLVSMRFSREEFKIHLT